MTTNDDQLSQGNADLTRKRYYQTRGGWLSKEKRFYQGSTTCAAEMDEESAYDDTDKTEDTDDVAVYIK